MKGETSKFLIGFMIGAIGGLFAGVLLAPDSGKVTRKKIVDKTGRIKQDLEDLAAAAKDSISDTVNEYWQETKPKSTKSFKR
ncbi:MAG: YtxH domain-containing protein [Cyclobacteriaceae bacterium]|nr:YtxH domain-containing protein [Cyclobacteriaceae bacterium]